MQQHDYSTSVASMNKNDEEMILSEMDSSITTVQLPRPTYLTSQTSDSSADSGLYIGIRDHLISMGDEDNDYNTFVIDSETAHGEYIHTSQPSMRQTDLLYAIHQDNDAFDIAEPNLHSFNMPYDTSDLAAMDASYINNALYHSIYATSSTLQAEYSFPGRSCQTSPWLPHNLHASTWITQPAFADTDNYC